MAKFNGIELPDEDGVFAADESLHVNSLHEELSEAELDEIENIIDSYEDYFFATYMVEDYFDDDWDDLIKEGARTAKITPGYDEVRYLPNGDPGYPGADPEFEDCDVDYDAEVERLFAKWLDDIASDEKVPGILRDNLNEQKVRDLLYNAYIDYMVPYTDEAFYDAVYKKACEDALEYEDYPDDDYDWGDR